MGLRSLVSTFRQNKIELLLIVLFAFLSLRVLNWFENPNILIGGDLRPPLNQEAFLTRSLYVWDEVDFGMPSIYVPRNLDPFYLLINFSEVLGAGLFISEMIAVFFLYFMSSLLMYFLVKELTGNMVVASISALFMTSNVFLVNDREILAICFIDTVVMVLPSLLVFVKALRNKSHKMAILSGMMINLTYGYFPNYRPTILALLMLIILWVYYMHNKEIVQMRNLFSITVNRSLFNESLKPIFFFFSSMLLSSVWILLLIFSNIDFLSSVYSGMQSPWYSRSSLMSVLMLIPKWSFYSGITINGVYYPYVPYSGIYLEFPILLFLASILTIFGLSAVFLCRNQKLVRYFGFVTIGSMLLVTLPSFTDFGMSLYLVLMEFPLLKVFRESTNWMFFLIFSLSVLVGLITSHSIKRFKRGLSRVVPPFFVISLIVVTSFPLYTGDISRNLINPRIKGAQIPYYYSEINELITNEYWTMLFPARETYVIYNFSNVGLSCGNPYPLLFSKPFVSGLGTEYINSGNTRMIDVLEEVVMNDAYFNVAMISKPTASSVQNQKYLPENAIDGDMGTRWASGLGTPQWFELDWNIPVQISTVRINFEKAYAEEYAIETWDGTSWVVQMVTKDNNSTELVYSFPDPIITTKLRIVFLKALGFEMVSLWEVEVLSKIQSQCKLLSIFGIKYFVLENTIIWGMKHEKKGASFCEENFILVKDWGEVELYNNTHAVERLYPADNLITNDFTLSEGDYALPEAVFSMIYDLEDLSWDDIQHTAFLYFDKSPITEKLELSIPSKFEWRQIDPTLYEATAEANGSFVIVFLESYNSNWKLYVNGELVPESLHVQINGFANGWLVSGNGPLNITIKYFPQQLFVSSGFASLLLPLLMLLLIYMCDSSRKDALKRLLIRMFKKKSVLASPRTPLGL